MTPTSSRPPPPPLNLTVRFSVASTPDVTLPVPSPHTTSVLSVKHRLRAAISSRSRLRLIYQGRILQDTSSVSSALRITNNNYHNHQAHHASTAGAAADPKGKGTALDVYVNCAIGDELTPQELLEEEEAAARGLAEEASTEPTSAATPSLATRRQQRGFDRLLSTGFTASEIATLRTQFASINADRYPPDAPPSPDTLVSLEDAWIDSNAGEHVATTAGGAAAATDDPSSLANGIDVLIRAMMVGFFWPLGSLAWALRQDHLWSDRWKVFVAAGVVMSVSSGILVSINWDD